MAGTIVVDRIESDSSYSSTINVASKVNFSGGFQVGGQDSPMAGFKNKIQNGDFRIFQRTTSNTTTMISGAVYRAPDRFATYNYNENGLWSAAMTIQQTRDHPTFGTSGTCLEYVCTTANTIPSYASGLCFSSILHHPEAQDVMELVSDSRKPFTISFWVKSNKVGTYSMHVRVPSPTGSSGNMMRAYTINQANTWEKKVIVFPSSSTAGCTNVTSLNGQGLGIEWLVASNFTPATVPGLSAINEQWGLYSTYGCASTGQVNLMDTVGNYFRITDIQLEIGTVATEFERRPIATELQLCKRYFETFRSSGVNMPLPTGMVYNNGDGTYSLYFNQKLEVAKRHDSPSVTFSANGSTLMTAYANNTSSAVIAGLWTGNPTAQIDMGTTHISWYHPVTNGSGGNGGMAVLGFLKTNQWINISTDL